MRTEFEINNITPDLHKKFLSSQRHYNLISNETKNVYEGNGEEILIIMQRLFNSIDIGVVLARCSIMDVTTYDSCY